MAIIVSKRNLPVPNLRRVRWVLLSLQNSLFTPVGQVVTERFIVVRKNFIPKVGGRKRTLYLGALLPKAVANKNVVLYRVPRPSGHLSYPIFTPFRRRVKALGVQVAPIIPVGTTGTGVNLQHFLGLSLLSLGGIKF